MVTQKEEKERRRSKRDKMASYFLDLSKLSFAAIVLGGFVPLLSNGTMNDYIQLTAGLCVTVLLAWLGYYILNK